MPVLVPGGVRPGGEVGQRLSGDLVGGVAEQLLRVLVPRRDRAGAVDLDDGDADPAVGERQQGGREGGAGGAGADRALRQVEVEPYVLQGGCVLHAPAVGEGRAQLEAAAALAVEVAHVGGGALEGDLAFGIVVGHLDPNAVVAAQAQDVGGGAGVDHGIGHQFAGEHHGVVDDVGMAPALERVAHEGPGARHGSSDGLEAGGRARGDHRTPRPSLPVHGLMADRLAPLLRQSTRRPGIRGLLPRDQSGGHSGRPSDARSSPCHRPDRTGPVRLDSRMQGYLPSPSIRMPVCSVSAQRVCGRCAKLPNCYGLVRPG
ncbi:hypothetical protein RKD29_005465 [Streptomyces tendae]